MSRKTISKNLSFDSQRRIYYVIFHDGSDGHGHRRRHARTFRTYQEALAAQRSGGRSSGEAESRVALPQQRCTLRTWMHYWLEEIIARDRAEATVYGYRSMARCHVLPCLGELTLAELTPPVLQSYLSQKMNEGLSPNTVAKHHVLLGACLRMAVRMEYLGRNPMERVDLPKKRATQFTYYNPKQIQALFAAVRGTDMELVVKLAAYLGLRRSEICGLRWDRVNLKEGLITINEVRTQVGGKPVTKSPKTDSSRRKLGIGGLRDLWDALALAYARRQERMDPQSLVLANAQGRAPEADQLSSRLCRIVRKNGLPPITLHGLRHSFASLANQAGVSMFDISRALGHSSMAVTSSVYTHLLDDTAAQALQSVARTIAQA